MSLTHNIVADLNLSERFNMNEAHQIRHNLQKNLPNARDRSVFADHYCFHTPYDVFSKAVDMGISIKDVANAIQEGAQKMVIANQLRQKLTNTLPTHVVYSAPGGIANHTGGSITINNGHSSSTITHEKPDHSSSTYEKPVGCAFFVEEEEDEVEPTLFHLFHQKTDSDFLTICIQMKDVLWKNWLESEGLVKGKNAEKFISGIEKTLKKKSGKNGMFLALEELTNLPKYRDMTRSEFIQTLQKIDKVKSLADEWSKNLAKNFQEDGVDHDKHEHDIRSELRKLLTKKKIFRGRNADDKLERAIDALTDDDVGVYELNDLKRMTYKDFRDLGMFNVNEAGKMEEFVKNI